MQSRLQALPETGEGKRKEKYESAGGIGIPKTPV
jgi:hypothetical protein